MSVSVQLADFDPAAEIAALGDDGLSGGVVSFVGLVREHHDGEAILAMNLEHYPGMTEAALAAIEAEARERWALHALRIIHRVGRLLPRERIVFVGVAAAHRHEAFAACAFVMDYLKTRAPFWKKEETPSGSRWVDARDSDAEAEARWQREAH